MLHTFDFPEQLKPIFCFLQDMNGLVVSLYSWGVFFSALTNRLLSACSTHHVEDQGGSFFASSRRKSPCVSCSDKDGLAKMLPSVWRVNRTADGWIPPSRVSSREFVHCVLTHFYVLLCLPVILQECSNVRNVSAGQGFSLEVEVSPVTPLCLWRSSDFHSSHHASGQIRSSHQEMCCFNPSAPEVVILSQKKQYYVILLLCLVRAQGDSDTAVSSLWFILCFRSGLFFVSFGVFCSLCCMRNVLIRPEIQCTLWLHLVDRTAIGD